MDAAADRLRGAEIHAGAVHGRDPRRSAWYARPRGEGGGLQLQGMAENVAAAVAVEVKVGVVRKVGDGIAV